MNGELMTGNMAAAWGARLADVDYVPAFPITPQTEIVEALAKWCDSGELAARFVTMDSEHSMMTAAGAAAATGARVFTATSSQGLLYAFEVLYTVSGWRVPLVLVNVSRALASPITLEPDHNDVLAARDCGFLQIHAETCQEVLDSILMAYRIAEDERVMLPVIVNLDGFYLSFTREPVIMPDPEQVRAFLPPFRPAHLGFKASAPHARGRGAERVDIQLLPSSNASGIDECLGGASGGGKRIRTAVRPTVRSGRGLSTRRCRRCARDEQCLCDKRKGSGRCSQSGGQASGVAAATHDPAMAG